jgi:hypothetical protein
MAFFQSLGIAALLTVTSNNRTRYVIMASPPSFRISPEMPSGPTDLFLPIAANLFLIISVLTTKLEDITLITPTLDDGDKRQSLKHQKPNSRLTLLVTREENCKLPP